MTDAATAIDSWRRWDAGLRTRPRIVKALAGGRSNRNYLLDAGDRALVLRLDAARALLPGGARHAEATAWRAASDAGIAPPLRFVDTGAGFLVSEYIPSDLPTRPEDDPVLSADALRLLQRCHRMQADLPAIDYRAHVENYWRMITSAAVPAESLAAQRREMQGVLETLLCSDLPWGICHHDPVVANFVGSGQDLYLVDWEYAARGLQLLDYAALAVEWGLDVDTAATRAGAEPRLLAMAQGFYRYLCGLWELLCGRNPASA